MAKKIITIDGLHKYHHSMVSALGLEQDNAKYQYSTPEVVPTKNTDGEWEGIDDNLKGAVDQLFMTVGEVGEEKWNASDYPFDTDIDI